MVYFFARFGNDCRLSLYAGDVLMEMHFILSHLAIESASAEIFMKGQSEVQQVSDL